MGLSPDSFSLETVPVALLLKVSRTEALYGLGVPRCVSGVTLPTGVGNLERVTHRELKASDAVNAAAFCFRYVPTILTLSGKLPHLWAGSFTVLTT